MEMTNDALVYEALQRLFRNAIVQYLRENLSRAYPDTYAAELHKPFKVEEWEAITRSADQAVATGVVDRTPKDDFDYLSVNHFYNLFELHFWALIPADELPDERYVPKLRAQLLAWLKDVKDLRDPLSHPPEEELS